MLTETLIQFIDNLWAKEKRRTADVSNQKSKRKQDSNIEPLSWNVEYINRPFSPSHFISKYVRREIATRGKEYKHISDFLVDWFDPKTLTLSKSKRWNVLSMWCTSVVYFVIFQSEPSDMTESSAVMMTSNTYQLTVNLWDNNNNSKCQSKICCAYVW